MDYRTSLKHIFLKGLCVEMQQSQSGEQVSEVETVADVAARLADCRQDLHIEFVATVD